VTARIVLADDESIIRLDLKEILESSGYDVVGEAANGLDALALIREHRPDLALLDIKMPEMDGLEVAREVQGQGTVVVLLTAFSQRDLIETARDTGVAAYLVKPFRAAELLPRLAALLNQPTAATDYVESRVADDKIHSRQLVQNAKERLMRDQSLSEPDAFDLIQRTAMATRSRMSDVAQRVLNGEQIG
jgi:two-component system, response regulator PdtaR